LAAISGTILVFSPTTKSNPMRMNKPNLTMMYAIICMLTFAFYACKKEETPPAEEEQVPSPAPQTDNYTSLQDFYLKNGVPKQTFTINAAAGGSFITPQATTVNIPPNAFSGATSIVTIEFRDIYKKSDMLLTDVGTGMIGGPPLKSAGEFFIKAVGSKNEPLLLAAGSKIEIQQPLVEPVDKAMLAFGRLRDSSANVSGWYQDPGYQLLSNATSYVFSLYQFAAPAANGTWCNSDNPQYFSAFSQTTLTIHPQQADFTNDVFLVFKNVNSMIHVYKSGTDFPYDYAPIGQECTVVVLSVKNGKLYSAFLPINISANQTVNVSVTETTTEAFKSKLGSLN
jgi:hypothetical protein